MGVEYCWRCFDLYKDPTVVRKGELLVVTYTAGDGYGVVTVVEAAKDWDERTSEELRKGMIVPEFLEWMEKEGYIRKLERPVRSICLDYDSDYPVLRCMPGVGCELGA